MTASKKSWNLQRDLSCLQFGSSPSHNNPQSWFLLLIPHEYSRSSNHHTDCSTNREQSNNDTLDPDIESHRTICFHDCSKSFFEVCHNQKTWNLTSVISDSVRFEQQGKEGQGRIVRTSLSYPPSSLINTIDGILTRTRNLPWKPRMRRRWSLLRLELLW